MILLFLLTPVTVRGPPPRNDFACVAFLAASALQISSEHPQHKLRKDRYDRRPREINPQEGRDLASLGLRGRTGPTPTNLGVGNASASRFAKCHYFGSDPSFFMYCRQAIRSDLRDRVPLHKQALRPRWSRRDASERPPAPRRRARKISSGSKAAPQSCPLNCPGARREQRKRSRQTRGRTTCSSPPCPRTHHRPQHLL